MKLSLSLLLTILGSIVFGSEPPTHYSPTYRCNVEHSIGGLEIQQNRRIKKVSTTFTTEKIEVVPRKPVEVDLDDSNQISVIFDVNNDDDHYDNERWRVRVIHKPTRKSLWCYNFSRHDFKRHLVIHVDGQSRFIEIVCSLHSYYEFPEQLPALEYKEWGKVSSKCLD